MVVQALKVIGFHELWVIQVCGLTHSHVHKKKKGKQSSDKEIAAQGSAAPTMMQQQQQLHQIQQNINILVFQRQTSVLQPQLLSVGVCVHVHLCVRPGVPHAMQPQVSKLA